MLQDLFRRILLTAPGLIACVPLAWPIQAAEPQTGRKAATVHLTDGDYATGQLVDSPTANGLLWQSPGFVAPFQFRLDAVRTIQFPTPEKPLAAAGQYRIELAAGDVLFGSLTGLRDDVAEVEVKDYGRLRVDRKLLRRMSRWNGGADIVYFGPNGLEGWKLGDPALPWQEDAGQLTTNKDGAALFRDVGLPDRARIEFELSWTGTPDFSISLGVRTSTPPATEGFRLEAWDKQLVALRETSAAADLAAVQDLPTGAGRIHLQVFVDQTKGRMLVFSSGGEQLIEFVVPSEKADVSGGLLFRNGTGNLRLERLSVSHWNGETPQSVEASRARVHLTDGTIRYGELQSFDTARGEIQLIDGDKPLTVPAGMIEDLYFPSSGEVAPRTFRAVTLSGLRISGDLLKVADSKIWLQCPGIAEPLTFATADLHSLQSHPLRQAAEPRPGTEGEPLRTGRLEADGVRLQGTLTDTLPGAAGRLAWRSMHSDESTLLKHGAAARIIYRERRTVNQAAVAVPTRTVVRAQPARAQGLLGLLFGGGATTAPQPARKPTTVAGKRDSVLHLRTGDTLPCEVTAINEEGVSFRSEMSEATFARHDQIKALELQPNTSPVTISRIKAERLLMLPRAQRDNAPTQLFRSVDGDYLRGRLIAMDDKELTVEVRLEERKIPRDRVARIIWLHANELESEEAGPSPAIEPEGVTRVQTIPRDGNRLTFVAEKVEHQVLIGRSELLGSCRVELANVDEVLVGPAIEEAAVALAFQQWRLTAAPDPLEAPDGEGGGSDGMESVLVGKAAPEIDLELLDGSRFQLDKRRGKVIVLDFWASWCGPCLQTMPQVDQVVREFANRDVELVGINLEETPERVKPVLQRLKLDLPVAFDRDGRVAERYGATAIPQTVIIDRDGKVARLFVGGGPRFDETLRTALEAVLNGTSEPMQ